MSYEKKCTICGAEYRYCPYCEEFKTQPKWKIMFCSEGCHETYLALNKYYYNHIDAETALKEIKKYNVKVDNKAITKQINEIKKAARPAKQDPVEEAISEEKQEVVTSESALAEGEDNVTD